MKTLFKIFFWIFAVFIFIDTAIIILTVWGPLYLMITEGQEFNWLSLIISMSRDIFGIFIIIMLYSQFYRHKLLFKEWENLIKVVVLLFYLVASALLFFTADSFFGPFQIIEALFLVAIIVALLKTDKIMNLNK